MPNVNVTYEEMRQAALRLGNGKTEIDGKLNELQKLVNGLVNGGYVTDASSKQFEAAFNEFTSGASKVIAGLDHMGEYLNRAATAFESADKELSTMLHRQ